MFGFVKRLLGFRVPEAVSSDPFSREKSPPIEAQASNHPVRVSQAVVLQRDEILDGRSRIAGYRFVHRLPETGQPVRGPATVELLSAHNVAAFAQKRVALIPIALNDWLAHDFRPLIAPNTIFVLPAPSKDALEAWGGVAAMIQQAGASVAVEMGNLGECLLPSAGIVNYLIVDFASYSLVNFEEMLGKVRTQAPQVKLIVENVGRWAEFRYCLSQGATYCLGTFTTEQDDAQQSQEISQSRLVLIDMLNLLRKEADLQDVAEVAKRDPVVVVKIIGMANSPMAGLRQPVASVDQAIMVLGRAQLYRWLAIGVFKASEASPRDEVLLELALARGRFLEVLGQDRHSKQECDEFFLLGLLSLLDCLLGVPMAKVVEKINLSPALRDVLLTSNGSLGRYLLLAIAVEKGHVTNVGRHAQSLGYSLEAIEAASVEAIGWAEDAIRQTS